jgi:outer membrane immunogenic protein
MKTLRGALLGLTALAALAFASTAADAGGYRDRGSLKDEGYPYVSWSGLYVGVHAGWQWSQIDNHFIPPGSTNDLSVNQDSGIAGVHVGYQHQFGALVLGVEANFTGSIDDDPGSTLCPNPAFSCEARFDNVLTVGARAGWAVGKWMPYITGGYANARYTTGARTIATGVLFSEGSERHGGWFIGGGLEWLVSHGWSVGLEYRHYEFNDELHIQHAPAGGVNDNPRFVDPSMDTVAVRLTWRFDRPEPAPLK